MSPYDHNEWITQNTAHRVTVQIITFVMCEIAIRDP